MDARGFSVPVFNSHVGFGFGTKIGQNFFFCRRAHSPRQLMGKPDGKRHQRIVLATREPERGNLVSGRYRLYLPGGELSFIEPVCRVKRKLLYTRQHTGSPRVEIEAIVSNPADYFPGYFGETERCLRSKSCGNENYGSGNRTLGDYP